MPAAPRSVIVSDRSIPLIRDPDPAGSRPPVFIHISTTPAHAFRAMTTDATSSQAGSGRIALQAHGKEAAFAELSCTYPLKLLSPRTPQDGVAVVYMLTYGGGLVGGDRIALSVDVGARTTLMLLSQVGVFFSFLFLSFFLRGDVSERGCCCRDRPRCSRRAAAGGRPSSTPPRRPQERWPLRPSEWTCTSRTARCSSSSPTR